MPTLVQVGRIIVISMPVWIIVSMSIWLLIMNDMTRRQRAGTLKPEGPIDGGWVVATLAFLAVALLGFVVSIATVNTMALLVWVVSIEVVGTIWFVIFVRDYIRRRK